MFTCTCLMIWIIQTVKASNQSFYIVQKLMTFFSLGEFWSVKICNFLSFLTKNQSCKGRLLMLLQPNLIAYQVKLNIYLFQKKQIAKKCKWSMTGGSFAASWCLLIIFSIDWNILKPHAIFLRKLFSPDKKSDKKSKIFLKVFFFPIIPFPIKWKF